MIPQLIGQYDSPKWGRVQVFRTEYDTNAALAITLSYEGGFGWEPLAVLSVNIDHGQPGLQSHELPPGHFYVKTWGQEDIVEEVLALTDLFEVTPMTPMSTGFVVAPVWRLK